MMNRMNRNSIFDQIHLRAYALDDSVLLRITTLDEWSRNRRKTASINPSSVEAHGGHIFADVRVIQALQTITSHNKRLYGWIEVFEKHYGVSFYTMKQYIYHTPQQVMETMNRRASVVSMKAWKTLCNKKRKRRILANCNMIIKMWTEGVEDMFAPGSTESAAFDEIEKDWCRGFE